MKNKLLLSTAIASVAFAGLASAETKIGGNLEQTFTSLSHDTPQTSARGFGAEHNISLSASKDLDNGLTATYGTVLESDSAGVADTHYLTVGTDTVNVSFARDHGTNLSSSAIPYIADNIGTAAGSGGDLTLLTANINDSDVHDNDHVSINAKVAGGTVSFMYAPDAKLGISPTQANDSESVDAEANNSAMGLIYSGSLGVEGLNILVGKTKQDGEGTAQDISETQYGASYNFGVATIGLERSKQKNNANTTQVDDIKMTQGGITFAASDNLTVGAYYSKAENETNAAETDEKIKMAQVGYNLGGLGISLSYADIENVNGAASTDAEVFQIRTIQKF
jgi:hypothetical protein